ncbi:MAG: MarR family EPS-associated transcriptional regulator [Candidatus Omnitrophica bacterium]|nr:MarR family EPS-associated transcriptional regulator [Candidatus Omnitrophota bacterium]MDD5352429.1 MarR family EPS-associated transcriptional regulator [Candidatus Omnitrophota bacterium]MDD5550027.1 MarR family EPS-associated transcriptional regulator [Candidatus Omnitrophota bacterium]
MSEQAPTSNRNKLEKEETLFFLAELDKYPHLTQRELASKLNVSLGKTNYLINELLKKGMIKVKTFSRKPNKLRRIKYLLTKKGMQEKISLMYRFLKKKESEYGKIKQEWEKLNNLLENRIS